MSHTERGLCRPGGFEVTGELLRISGLDRESAASLPLRVLDVGCGEGATVEYLRNRFPAWEISGLDKNPAFCTPGMIETGRAEALPAANASMDVVFMECSLSKTESPEKALQEALRVLKPEGWLLISDMYARKKELLADGLLGRLELAERIWHRMMAVGFSVLEMQDMSGMLIQWAGQQILDGNGSILDGALGADRKSLKEAGCGYYYCAARPSGLWETLSYAGEKSPFYREMFREAGLEGRICPGDWETFRSLPFTTPEDIREKPERFLCVPAKEIARIITLRTSGSSGNPKRLFFTEDDLMRTADFYEIGMQYLVKPGETVTVYMEGPGLFSVGGLLKEGLSRIQVDVTVHGLIRDLEAAARDGEDRACFVGVPGQMYSLAVYAPWLRPKTVLLSADYVPESVLRFLESTWKCRVFTHWAMTETGYGGGVQCGAREGYHMRDGDLLLEVIDPDTGLPVPEGEYGELVLTAFYRRGMPLIRYRTGDVGRYLLEPCGCGCLKPRLAKVEGRLDDVIRLPDGKLLSMHILDELLLSSGEIQDFEAAYDRDKKLLRVSVMAGRGKEPAREAQLLKVQTLLEDYFEGVIRVEAEEKNVSPYIGSGKRKIRIFQTE